MELLCQPWLWWHCSRVVFLWWILQSAVLWIVWVCCNDVTDVGCKSCLSVLQREVACILGLLGGGGLWCTLLLCQGFVPNFYTYVTPLGSHVGAQLLVYFCISTLDLMMTAWRSKHVVFYDHSEILSITFYTVALMSFISYIRVKYSTVKYSKVQYSTVEYSTVQYSTVKYSREYYSVAQYSTVQYNTLQYSTTQYSTVQYHRAQ